MSQAGDSVRTRQTGSSCLGGIFLTLLLLGGARAKEAKKDEPILKAQRASEALGRIEDARKSTDELPQELKSIIIDKPKIAEESAKRAVGLREAGNPHIPSELLLSHIQDDPTV